MKLPLLLLLATLFLLGCSVESNPNQSSTENAESKAAMLDGSNNENQTIDGGLVDTAPIDETTQPNIPQEHIALFPNPSRSSFAEWESSLTSQDLQRITDKISLYRESPELTGISGYLNAENGLKISDFRGKVVLIDFWTYSCINCIRTRPYFADWDKKYKDLGLAIIGVHTPEFDFEKDAENVRLAMEKHGIEYRVVLDNEYKTWREFGNRYWPRRYLIDKDGFIRYDRIGEGEYAKTEEMIKVLLSEPN